MDDQDPLMPPPNPNRWRRCSDWKKGCPHDQLHCCGHPTCLKSGPSSRAPYWMRLHAEHKALALAMIAEHEARGERVWADWQWINGERVLVCIPALDIGEG